MSLIIVEGAVVFGQRSYMYKVVFHCKEHIADLRREREKRKKERKT